MHTFISGALPPASVAPELARQLPALAPRLLGWFEQSHHESDEVSPHDLGCTPAEAWMLDRAGFRAGGSWKLGAGLGPLRAGVPPVAALEPIWIADLAYMAIGTDGARLGDTASLDVTEEEGRALLEAARSCLEASGFSADFVAPGRWRMRLPPDFAFDAASPAAASVGMLEDWWPQTDAMRPWRRLLNEIQMVWHEHPINEMREARGAPPVNGLWLYGGGRPWNVETNDDVHLNQLDAAQRTGDWAAWLDALPALDQAFGQISEQVSHLVLTGNDRWVLLAPRHRAPLLAWLPKPKKNWNDWWHPRA